jgi:hypothetical protein
MIALLVAILFSPFGFAGRRMFSGRSVLHAFTIVTPRFDAVQQGKSQKGQGSVTYGPWLEVV